MERDKLLGTMDAKVWTDEFMATRARLGDKEFDHAMMLAWFANAIMAGFDEANRRAQRALDAEREKVKALEEQLRLANCDQANTEADLNDVTAQLAALQAQLRKPILVCQRCGRVSQDGWVPSRYECDELNGSLQCPDCQCIDLEINTAKELATLCTQAQAQLRQVEGENQRLKEAAQQARQEALREARQSISRLFDENQSGTPEYYCALLDAGNELDRLAREGVK